jgi:predicted ATPase
MVRAHTEARRGGARSYRPIDIQSVILDRMDHLHPELKRVLQIAASMGRVFSRPLLEEVLGGCEGQGRDVQELLWDLEDQALLHQERSFQEQEYSFSHVITQETIYGSIALPARKRLHEQVALGIERLWAGSLDERYEELAYHFSRSGNAEKAVGYLLKAGRKARLHSANGVAAAHLTSGIALLAHLPQTEQRKRIELAYHQTLGVCLSFTKGHSSGKVVEVFTRAMELSREVGGVEDRFMAALGLRRHHLLRGDLSRARHWDGELQSLAESADDQGLRERAYLMRAETCLYTGEFQRVIDLCGLAQEYHDPARALAQAHAIGTCPGIMCGVLETLAQWHRGNPDQALRMSERTITSALEMGHPTSLLYAKTYYLMLLQHRREADAVADRAREVVALAREQDNHLLLTVGGMLSGWAVAMQGNAQTGRKWIESLLAAARADHVGGWFCYFSGLLSEAYLKENLLEKALSTVSYALERAEVTGERFWEAELFRLKAEILSKSKASATRSPSASGEDEGIEDLLVKAMDAARGQGSLALELRAAVAYGRHRKEQGRDGWQKIVRGVFRKCSEGFNTPDLLDAKDLLARK